MRRAAHFLLRSRRTAQRGRGRSATGARSSFMSNDPWATRQRGFSESAGHQQWLRLDFDCAPLAYGSNRAHHVDRRHDVADCRSRGRSAARASAHHHRHDACMCCCGRASSGGSPSAIPGRVPARPPCCFRLRNIFICCCWPRSRVMLVSGPLMVWSAGKAIEVFAYRDPEPDRRLSREPSTSCAKFTG